MFHTITQKKFGVVLIIVFLLTLSCKKNNAIDGIPYARVNIQMNLNEPIYNKLLFANNFVYVAHEGVRGILVINYNGAFYALERSCPYQFENECAKVSVLQGTLQLMCGSYNGANFDSCCKSTYSFDGNVLRGPSSIPLRRYAANYTDGVLYITN